MHEYESCVMCLYGMYNVIVAPKKPAGAVAVMVGMGGGGGAAPLLPANGPAKPGELNRT